MLTPCWHLDYSDIFRNHKVMSHVSFEVLSAHWLLKISELIIFATQRYFSWLDHPLAAVYDLLDSLFSLNYHHGKIRFIIYPELEGWQNGLLKPVCATAPKQGGLRGHRFVKKRNKKSIWQKCIVAPLMDMPCLTQFVSGHSTWSEFQVTAVTLPMWSAFC